MLWHQPNTGNHARPVQALQFIFTYYINMVKLCHLFAFGLFKVVRVRLGDLNISETADFLGFFTHSSLSLRVYTEWCEKQKTPSERPFCGQKCLINERDQRRIARLFKLTEKVW